MRRTARWISIIERRAVIPVSWFKNIGDQPLLRITFRIPHPRAPSGSKASVGQRLLGLGVRELVVREK
jgi:hypothetical protein